MTLQSKKEYLEEMRERYRKEINRKQKSQIISEVIVVLKVHRKHAIRALNKKTLKRAIPRERKYIYGIDLIAPLKLVWEIDGRPCSKRLQPQIPLLIKQLKKFGELKLYGNQEKLLCKMSNWTIDTFLLPERERLKGKGISGTKRSPLLKTLIPIRTEWDDVNIPGHLEIDCVLHCGEGLTGTYAETVNMIDIETHWNEKRMVLKKTERKVIGTFHQVKTQFPFPILSVDFDNGHEFVNWGMYGYCKRNNITFTRSRPYHKNDQAHIEGKNYQSVRRIIGYGRITDEKIVEAFNDLYENEHRLLTNFFYPTLKLIKKIKVNGKDHKKYEVARTPYARVLESNKVSDEIKQKLLMQYEQLNPAKLHRSLQRKLQKIRKLLG